MEKNPLLQNLELPPFSDIKTDHVEEAVSTRLAELNKALSKIEAQIVPNWGGLVDPLCELEELLHRTWSPVDHLNHVANSNELRVVHEKAFQQIVDFNLRFLQSKPIFDALCEIQNGGQWCELDEAQRRSIKMRIQSAELAGLALKGKEREEFNQLNKQLSQLEIEFSNRLLDSSKEFVLLISDKSDIAGLPDTLLELTSQIYNQKYPDQKKSEPKTGPWAITLDAPVFVPFLENCPKPELRKKVYLAYISRASSGTHDNTPSILEILKIRKRIASLLGYKNYAEVSLSRKMVSSVEQVLKFEEELRTVAFKKAQDEFKELENFAKSKGWTEKLRHWDIAFWAKRLQEELFKFKDEDLKPYFSFDQVLAGMFLLTKKLFSVQVRLGKAATWNSDVRFYKVFNEKDQHIASFFLDAFSRPQNKRGGAWVGDCVTRYRFQGKLSLPVAYVNCNFSPATESKPSLLSFQDVTTLFHEFGHALQHMLTTLDYRDVSGTNGIEWDAIELASQFMENWCYHRATLRGLGKHYETGETIPESLIDKLMESRTFRAGSQMLRQIGFALIDMKLHSEFDPDGKRSVFDLYKDVVQKTSVLPFLEEDKMLCGFAHIFAGGYAAGYYSYKWAELMSADAFSKFEEAGLDKEETLALVGKQFRDTILALGGGRDPLEVFKDFRGRAPSTEPLLRHSGLLA